VLQEQRESLKEQGLKHEDNIMKDNARLQKEVKSRIMYMKNCIEDINKGTSKNSKKNLVLELLDDFLSFKNDVNISVFRIRIRKVRMS
jgi:hypothetical protein